MKHRVFIDTNVFIYAFEFPDSNSNIIIELLNDEKTGKSAGLSNRERQVRNYGVKM